MALTFCLTIDRLFVAKCKTFCTSCAIVWRHDPYNLGSAVSLKYFRPGSVYLESNVFKAV